jgi:hypothetical protein
VSWLDSLNPNVLQSEHSAVVVSHSGTEQAPVVEVEEHQQHQTNQQEAQPVVQQEDGNDLQLFLDFVSGETCAPIFSTPPRVNPHTDNSRHEPSAPNTQQRKSARLADKAKHNAGLGSMQLAQQVLVKKLGELIPGSQPKTDSDLTACSFGWWLMAGADLF